MSIHTIVYVALSILIAIAFYAASLPIRNVPREEQQAASDDKDELDIL